MSECKHPANRIYSWVVRQTDGVWLCAGCCDCGATWEKKIKEKI